MFMHYCLSRTRYCHHTRVSLSTITVLGGGVTGTSIVAMLVTRGHEVTWIDEKHQDVGRMGRYYNRGVPANTLNGVLLKGLQGVAAFEYDNFVRHKSSTSSASDMTALTLSDLPADSCADLKYLCEPLRFASSQLLHHPKVNAIKGKLITAEYSNSPTDVKSPWSFVVCPTEGAASSVADGDVTTFGSQIFFMAQGAKPSFPSNIPPHFPHQNVDVFVNSFAVNDIIERNPEWRDTHWAVVGSSHSAMLVVKNLVEAGVKNVINFYRSDFVFETQAADGSFRNRGSGLKGGVGEWVRKELESCMAVTRKRLAEDEELAIVTPPFGDKVIYAVGYERENTFDLVVDGQPICPQSLASYDKLSGEITSVYQTHENNKDNTHHFIKQHHCFGLGIAFPTNYTSEDGHTEAWVGFHRNIEQLTRILPTIHQQQ